MDPDEEEALEEAQQDVAEALGQQATAQMGSLPSDAMTGGYDADQRELAGMPAAPPAEPTPASSREELIATAQGRAPARSAPTGDADLGYTATGSTPDLQVSPRERLIEQAVQGPGPRSVDWGQMPGGGLLEAARETPVGGFLGDRMADVGRGMEWATRNLANPVEGAVNQIPRGLNYLSGDRLAQEGSALRDPDYQALMERDPAAAARYARENYSFPFISGAQEILTDPTSYLGTGLGPAGLRGAAGAAGTAGHRGLAAGIGRAADAAGWVDDLANLAPRAVSGPLGQVAEHIPGLRTSAQSRAIQQTDTFEEGLRGALREGAEFGQPPPRTAPPGPASTFPEPPGAAPQAPPAPVATPASAAARSVADITAQPQGAGLVDQFGQPLQSAPPAAPAAPTANGAAQVAQEVAVPQAGLPGHVAARIQNVAVGLVNEGRLTQQQADAIQLEVLREIQEPLRRDVHIPANQAAWKIWHGTDVVGGVNELRSIARSLGVDRPAGDYADMGDWARATYDAILGRMYNAIIEEAGQRLAAAGGQAARQAPAPAPQAAANPAVDAAVAQMQRALVSTGGNVEQARAQFGPGIRGAEAQSGRTLDEIAAEMAGRAPAPAAPTNGPAAVQGDDYAQSVARRNMEVAAQQRANDPMSWDLSRQAPPGAAPPAPGQVPAGPAGRISVTDAYRGERDPETTFARHALVRDGEQVGFVEVTYNHRTGELYVNGIGDNSGLSAVEQAALGPESLQNQLGPGAVRGMIRDLVEQFYPDAKRIAGHRATGARPEHEIGVDVAAQRATRESAEGITPAGPTTPFPTNGAVQAPPAAGETREVLGSQLTRLGTPAPAFGADFAATHASLLRDVPPPNLTPQMQRALQDARPYEQAYTAAQRAAPRLEQLRQSQVPADRAAAARIEKEYGLQPGQPLDPVNVVVGTYFRDYARSIGFDPSRGNPGFFNALATVYNEWKAGVLISEGYHLRNTLDMIGKSALEGISPFVGGHKQFFDRIGLDRVPASLVSTMGRQGVSHDQYAGQMMQQIATRGVLPGVGRGTVEEFAHAWRDPNTFGLATRPWGTLKALNASIAGALESTARLSAYRQGFERQMTAELNRLGRAAPPEVQRALYGLQDWSRDGFRAAVGPHAERLGPLFDAAWDRAHRGGLKLTEKVHFNYSSRSELEQAGLVKALIPFSKWALGNLKYYAEALVSRPALWSVLSAYDRFVEAEQEPLGEGLPNRLERHVRLDDKLPGGWGGVLANAAFGNPHTQVFANPAALLVAIRAQVRDTAFVGRGSTGAGQALATFNQYTGMALNPMVDIPLKAFGLYGDVPVSAPFSVRQVPGRAIQGAVSAVAPNVSFEQEFNRGARSLPGGLNERFADPRIVQGGAGPLNDRAVNERIMTNAARRGLDPQSPEVQRALATPGHPLREQAQRDVANEQGNWQQQAVQGSVGLKGLTSERAGAIEAQQGFQRALDAGMPFEQALAQHPGANTYWNMNAARDYLSEKATYGERGLGYRTEPIATEVGAQRPQYPGREARPEQFDQYGQALLDYQQRMAGGLRTARDRYDQFEAREAQLPAQANQRYRDLEAQGYHPWADQWEQARYAERTDRAQLWNERTAVPTAFPINRPSFEERIAADPALRRSAELRGYLETLPPEQRARAYASGPEFRELREYDQRGQPDQFRVEERYRELGNTYYGALNQIMQIENPKQRAEAFAAAKQQYAGSSTQPGFADWLDRNTPLQERLKFAIAEKFWADYNATPLGTGARSRAFNADPVVTKVAMANTAERAALTQQEVEYAANRLGLTLAPQTVAPTRQQYGAAGDLMDNYDVLDPRQGPRTVSLGARQEAIQGGAMVPGEAPTGPRAAAAAPAVSSAAVAARGGLPSSARGGSARGGPSAATAEPFSGRTPQQQLASAHREVARLRDTQGQAAGAKFIYDNYQRFADLKQALGETLPPRGYYGSQALSLSTRPGAFEGMTMQQGYQRLKGMRDMLEGAQRGPINADAFARQWQERFGERLAPRDLTQQGLQEKLDWVVANQAQAARYRNTAEGQREGMQAERLYNDARALRAEQNRLRDQLAAYGRRYQQLRASGDRRAASQYWAGIQRERERVQREYEQARQRAERAYQAAQQGRSLPTRSASSSRTAASAPGSAGSSRSSAGAPGTTASADLLLDADLLDEDDFIPAA